MEIINEVKQIFNAGKTLDNIITWLQEYKELTNCNGVVLGISGGKDSTVVAMLSKLVWGDNVVGVMMPNGEQSDINDSISVVNVLGIRNYTVNINDVYKTILKSIEVNIDGNVITNNCPPVSNKAKTNIPPRIRMTVLYAIAQTLGYRVIGTGNFSESFIGWTTKWGDSAYDLNPIAQLTCSEVIEVGKILAQRLGLDESFVVKTPSDGLTNKTDEENFGFTYSELDEYIRGTTGEKASIPDDIVYKILSMFTNSAHKRKMPYTMLH